MLTPEEIEQYRIQYGFDAETSTTTSQQERVELLRKVAEEGNTLRGEERARRLQEAWGELPVETTSPATEVVPKKDEESWQLWLESTPVQIGVIWTVVFLIALVIWQRKWFLILGQVGLVLCTFALLGGIVLAILVLILAIFKWGFVFLF